MTQVILDPGSPNIRPICSDILLFSKKSPTGPTERTPKPEYLIALATCLGVRWGLVPFNFRIRPRSGCQIVSAVKCRCWVNTFQCLDLEFKPWWMKQATGWWQLKYFFLFTGIPGDSWSNLTNHMFQIGLKCSPTTNGWTFFVGEGAGEKGASPMRNSSCQYGLC